MRSNEQDDIEAPPYRPHIGPFCLTLKMMTVFKWCPIVRIQTKSTAKGRAGLRTSSLVTMLTWVSRLVFNGRNTTGASLCIYFKDMLSKTVRNILRCHTCLHKPKASVLIPSAEDLSELKKEMKILMSQPSVHPRWCSYIIGLHGQYVSPNN